MNIFILDNDIQTNVKYYFDKHVVKMLLEYTQILATVCNITHKKQVSNYKSTHINHPAVKWVMESLDNWLYLRKLLRYLHKEWQYRYNHPKNKLHKSYKESITLPFPKLPKKGVSPFVSITDKYKSKDIINNYRDYYISKKHLASWKNRRRPTWFI